MKKLLTTSSDDSLWPLSNRTLPHLLNSINWKHDYYHFHDGDLEMCRKVVGANVKKIQPSSTPLNNPTNNVYRNIVEFLRENRYDRWLHFDGDVFVGGIGPEEYVNHIVAEDRPGTRLQPYGILNLLKDGAPRFGLYEVISSQAMYVSAEDAIKKCDDVIYKRNVPWTFECALHCNFEFYPCRSYPLHFFVIHCHVPHDRSPGEERLERLEKFLTKYHAFEEFKYRDSAKYPFAGPLYREMLEFRSQIVGNCYAVENEIMIRNKQERDKYVINFDEYARRVTSPIGDSK